jgi:Fe-S-cluster containining protein
MKRLAVLQDRPITAKWRCQQSGDCCSQPADVVMSTMEAALILQQTAGAVALDFRKTSENFVALKAQPCPLYDATYQVCTVYDIRPYNCRRFACMRPDPKTEPWETSASDGCLNREDRLDQSRIVRRQAKQIQAKAMPWARAHGWRPDAP